MEIDWNFSTHIAAREQDIRFDAYVSQIKAFQLTLAITYLVSFYFFTFQKVMTQYFMRIHNNIKEPLVYSFVIYVCNQLGRLK